MTGHDAITGSLYVAPAGQTVSINDGNKDPMPSPCPDCGRAYTRGSSVQVRSEGRQVWTGCMACWVTRTSPEMCATFSDENEQRIARVLEVLADTKRLYRMTPYWIEQALLIALNSSQADPIEWHLAGEQS